MSDIFVSYAREDRGKVEQLAHALVSHGWTVFWDQTIPAGKTWREMIGNQLDAARCVVVVWSKSSIVSEWVLEEADAGKERGVLVPVLVERIRPPLGFRNVQAADLSDWDGTTQARAFAQLLADISQIPGFPSPAQSSSTTQTATSQPSTLSAQRATSSGNEHSVRAPVASDEDAIAGSPALFAPPSIRIVLPILLAALVGCYASPRVGGLAFQFISLQIMAVAYLGYRYGRRVGLIAGVIVFLPEFLGHIYGYATANFGDPEQRAAWQGTLFAGRFSSSFGAFRTYGVAYLYLALVGVASAVLKEQLSAHLRSSAFVPREGYAPLSVTALMLFVMGGYLLALKISIGPLSFGGVELGFLLPMILVYRYGPTQARSAIRLMLPAACVYYAGGAVRFGYTFSPGNVVLVCLFMVAIACITQVGLREVDPKARGAFWALTALLVIAGSWHFDYAKAITLYAAWLALPLVIVIGSRCGARSGFVAGITWGWANIISLDVPQTLAYGAPMSFLIAAPVLGYLAGLVLPRWNFLAIGATLLTGFYLLAVVGRFALAGFSLEQNVDELVSPVLGYVGLVIFAPLARSSKFPERAMTVKP